MQRGFIQIPILIAILVGVVVLGGTGYFAYEVGQKASVNTSEPTVATTTTDTQATTTTTASASDTPQTSNQISAPKQTSTSQPSNIASGRKILSNSEIIKRVKPATVFIETTKGTGSGMIMDASGYILTNAHVVWDVSAAKIKLSDGRSLSAEVVGRDEIVDLAILKIVGASFPAVTFGNSGSVAQGDEVFTLGYPFGLEGDVSFKEGTISRRISDGDATYLETSAEIHPGNSGGPLVNKYGEVVGVNSAGYGYSAQGVNIGETIKLAIPINVAKELIPQLKGGRNIVIDHAQYESSESTGGGSNDIATKAQCAQLGLARKEKEDAENPFGGTTAYGYSTKLSTCVYGRLYLSELMSIGSFLFSGQIWDLLTGEQVYRTDPIMWNKSTPKAELDQLESKQESARAELWAVYNSLTK